MKMFSGNSQLFWTLMGVHTHGYHSRENIYNYIITVEHLHCYEAYYTENN